MKHFPSKTVYVHVTKMRLLLGCAVAVGASGCTRQVALHEPAAQTTPAPRGAEAPVVRAQLQSALVEVERLLLRVQPAESVELRHRRLALTVALAQLDPDTSASADELEADAAAQIEAHRRRLSDSSKSDTFSLDLPKTPALVQPLADRVQDEEKVAEELSKEEHSKKLPVTTEEIDGPAAKPRLEPPAPAERCSPGDPLCGVDDDDDGDRVVAGKIGPARVAVAAEPTPVLLHEVRRQYARVEACVPRARRDRERKVSVQLMLDGTGYFRQVRVQADDLGHATTSCIADVFHGMYIADDRGDSQVITVPLWIRPAP